MRAIVWVFLPLLAWLHTTEGCGTKSIECKNSTAYQFCFDTGSTIIYVDGIESCDPGEICDENEGLFNCVAETSSTSTTIKSTTTESTTTPSTTTTTQSTTSTTTASTTTTTTVAATTTDSPTPPDSCTTAGVYPSSECNQYYECVSVFWWYELVLQTCTSGQSFNSTAGACTDDSNCPATTTTSTTTTSPSTTSTTKSTTASTSTTTETTTTAVTAPASCDSVGKYPSENCNQYYECVAFLWWYSLEVKTCETGQAFDGTTLTCVASSTCTTS